MVERGTTARVVGDGSRICGRGAGRGCGAVVEGLLVRGSCQWWRVLVLGGDEEYCAEQSNSTWPNYNERVLLSGGKRPGC